MKIILLVFTLVFLFGCTDSFQELAFRKTLEYELIDLCGKKDKKCIAAVKSQIKNCMIKSNWKKFVENQNSDTELKRFTTEFYSCVVDENGEPYFEPK
ncbi:MAG: hypothetical protein ACC653_11740 [Gammaproteobacteria bacterium]